VTIYVIRKAREHGLDLLSILSHTSHALHPLDNSIFKPFKTAFKVCRDMWVTSNKVMHTKKTILVQLISRSLRVASTL
jgi:hypothetical protein